MEGTLDMNITATTPAAIPLPAATLTAVAPPTLGSLDSYLPSAHDVNVFLDDTLLALGGAFPVMGAAFGVGAVCSAEGCNSEMAAVKIRAGGMISVASHLGGLAAFGTGHPFLGAAGLAVAGISLAYAGHAARKDDGG